MVTGMLFVCEEVGGVIDLDPCKDLEMSSTMAGGPIDYVPQLKTEEPGSQCASPESPSSSCSDKH